MPALECLACGESFYALGGGRSRCHTCGGSHLHATTPGYSSSRVPRVFHPGDHASLIYRDDRRMLDAVLPLIRAGLSGNRRVVCVVDHELAESIRAGLRGDEFAEVEFFAPAEVYGEPLQATAAIQAYTEMLESGARPMTAIGGFDRAVAARADIDQIRALEQGAEHLFDAGLIGLCLYDARFCPQEMLDLAADHPVLTGTSALHLAA